MNRWGLSYSRQFDHGIIAGARRKTTMADAWQSRYYRRRMVKQSRKITWLVIAVLLLAAPCGGYAWYRSYVAQQLAVSLNNWILARIAEGYRIDAEVGSESGGWLTAVQPLTNVAIAAPRDDWEIRLPVLAIAVETLNPFKVNFTPEPSFDLRYTVADVEYGIAGAIRKGTLGFTYDTSGQLNSVFVRSLSGKVEGAVDLDIGSLQVDTKFDPAAASAADGKTVEIDLGLDDATLLQPANLPLGNVIKRVEIGAYVSGPLQPGRPSESLAAWRDAGGVLQIQSFAADWGQLAVTAEGTLALDGSMQPLFAGTATVRGYSEAIDALVQARMMDPGGATGAKIALAAMAKPADDGGPPAAKLPITIQDGFLFVGPLRLAQMPRIVWQ